MVSVPMRFSPDYRNISISPRTIEPSASLNPPHTAVIVCMDKQLTGASYHFFQCHIFNETKQYRDICSEQYRHIRLFKVDFSQPKRE